MKLRYYHILVPLMIFVLRAQAQKPDTVIKSNTIEITQSYQPEIKQNPRPVLHPTLPPADTTYPVFTYDVPQQTLFYTYNSTPLRPLALGRDSANAGYRRYIKLGGGNLSTLQLDFGEEGKGNNTTNQTADHSLQLHTISQKGDIKDQQTWLTNAHFDGSVYRQNWLWHLSVDALRNQYYFYGYDHDLYQYSSSELSQIYTGVRASVDVTNQNSSSFHYNPKITASVYDGNGGNDKASEKTFGILLPTSYNIDTSLQFKAALNATITQYKVSLDHINNNIIQFAPGFEYHKVAFNGHAYLNPTFGQKNTYLLPDIFASYKLPIVTLNAGWQGLLHQNSFEQLSTENPYIFAASEIKQTHSDEIFGGLDASLGNHLLVSGRVSAWHYNDLPVFVNAPGDQKQFNILYENQLNAVSFHIAGRYQVGHTFAAGLSGTWYSFNGGNLPQIWQVPTSKIKGDLLFHPISELNITAYIALLDGLKALDNNGNAVTMNSVFDIGGNVEYDIVSRFAVFLQLSNLLNNKNERWYGYTSYGFNIIGGIRFKF